MTIDNETLRMMQEVEQDRQRMRDHLKKLPPHVLFDAFYRAKDLGTRFHDPSICVVGSIAMAYIADLMGEMLSEGKLEPSDPT